MSRRSSPPAAKPADRSRLAFLLCVIVLFAATIGILSGSMWIEVLYRTLVEGGFALIWLASATGIGAAILSISRISSRSKSLGFATSAAAGLGVISLATLGLGLAGLLNRGSAVGVVTIGLVAGASMLVRHRNNLKFQISKFDSMNWFWLLVVPVAAIALAGAFVLPGVLWGDEPHGYDVLEYHLQVPREWFELGRIAPLQHNVFSHFPFNVEMHFLLAMHLRGGPWAGMYLAQVMHLIFVALTVIAVYGIVIERTARPRSAIVAAVVCASVPWLPMLGAVAYDDGGLLLFGTLAVGWVMLSRNARDMILAGAMAGFACGTKLTGVPTVLVAVPIAAIASSLSLRGRAGVSARGESDITSQPVPPHPNPLPWGEGIRGAVIFIAAGILTFSPWLIRNLVWAGNPVFPEAMPLLGKAHFTDVQVERWERAHSPTEDQKSLPGRLKALGTQIIGDWRYGILGIPVELGALILARKNRSARFLGILLGLHLIFWLGFTHLQGRFFVLAIPIGAILVGLVELLAWNFLLGLSASVAAGVGCALMGATIARVDRAMGVEDYRALLLQTVSPREAEYAKSVFDGEGTLVLIGEARAFQFQIPIRRLRYRTVFDLLPPPYMTPIDAWINPYIPEETVAYINTGELVRLSNTYFGVPFPPEVYGTFQEIKEARRGAPRSPAR